MYKSTKSAVKDNKKNFETAIILINCIGTKQRNIPLHTLIIQ
jgi:hypothetical protein